MTFGDALEELKRGRKVYRKGWHDAETFLWLREEIPLCSNIQINAPNKQTAVLLTKFFNTARDAALPATICMYVRDCMIRRMVVTGWTPSQADMLSDDWVVAND